jgi:translocator protein
LTSRRIVLGLIVWLAVCYGAAAVGAQFMPGAWYQELAKPAWTPPSWLFAPVWTVLYGMMAVAAWIVWRQQGVAGAPAALSSFVAQLLLNTLWSWLFFGTQRPDLAMLDIMALWIAILLTAGAFWGRSRVAALLLVPYLLWVSFAAALNWSIWRLNS